LYSADSAKDQKYLMTDFNLTQLFKHPHYGLLGLLTCLFGGYLVIVWRTEDIAYFGMSVLFLLAAITLLWENHASFIYRFEPIAALIGIGLILWVVWHGASIAHSQQPELRLIPFVAAVAVALLASGLQGLVQYRRELAIMFFLGIPGLLLSLIDIAPITATTAAKLLIYTGHPVMQRGVLLASSGGTVEVTNGYSGIQSITYLLGIAVLCLTLYPVHRLKQILALLAAAGISFGFNTARIAMMATLVAPQNQKAFLYWSEGDGSLILGVLALVSFTSFYLVLYQLEMWQKQHLQN
jgi:cyanoexosortase A